MKAVRQVGRDTPCAPSLNVRTAARRGLTCPTITLRPGLERDTQLMPWLIAESVCTEVSRFLDVELPVRYAVWLDAKAERFYAGHRRFYHLMRGQGNAPRDWLYVFMRHWLASLLQLERPDLTRCLPVEFSYGKPLPREPYRQIRRLSYLAHLLPKPRDWQPSRATRHFRWAWLKQVEAADVAECRHRHLGPKFSLNSA